MKADRTFFPWLSIYDLQFWLNLIKILTLEVKCGRALILRRNQSLVHRFGSKTQKIVDYWHFPSEFQWSSPPFFSFSWLGSSPASSLRSLKTQGHSIIDLLKIFGSISIFTKLFVRNFLGYIWIFFQYISVLIWLLRNTKNTLHSSLCLWFHSSD